MKNKLIERLISYAKVDTQSNENSQTTPSTPGRLALANMLVEELKEIGMKDVTIDENGYVMATLPSNTEKEVPTIGFLAHVDTATDFTGKNVNPQVIEQYDGKDIVLNESLNVVLSPKEFPELADYAEHTLITTDGTTLLGADNKAGISEIMTAMEYLIAHPEIKHGKIRVAFTPDEEIGRGPHKFDVEAFNAKFAYTVDGGPLGELQYESFNAAAAKSLVKERTSTPAQQKEKWSMPPKSRCSTTPHCRKTKLLNLQKVMKAFIICFQSRAMFLKRASLISLEILTETDLTREKTPSKKLQTTLKRNTAKTASQWT